MWTLEFIRDITFQEPGQQWNKLGVLCIFITEAINRKLHSNRRLKVSNFHSICVMHLLKLITCSGTWNHKIISFFCNDQMRLDWSLSASVKISSQSNLLLQMSWKRLMMPKGSNKLGSKLNMFHLVGCNPFALSAKWARLKSRVLVLQFQAKPKPFLCLFHPGVLVLTWYMSPLLQVCSLAGLFH